MNIWIHFVCKKIYIYCVWSVSLHSFSQGQREEAQCYFTDPAYCSCSLLHWWVFDNLTICKWTCLSLWTHGLWSTQSRRHIWRAIEHRNDQWNDQDFLVKFFAKISISLSLRPSLSLARPYHFYLPPWLVCIVNILNISDSRAKSGSQNQWPVIGAEHDEVKGHPEQFVLEKRWKKVHEYNNNSSGFS